MARYAEPMARLIDELKKLPGVGTKTAQRFAFHILRSTASMLVGSSTTQMSRWLRVGLEQ